MRSRVVILISSLWLLVNLTPLLEALFFPTSSILQLTSSVSVPLEDFFPERLIITDWCFQMNFDLPYKLSSFYNIPIWPGHSRVTRALRAPSTELENTLNGTHVHLYKKYERSTTTQNRHPSDFYAGEFYQGLEDIFTSYGIHETCLLRSVCDLAQHPFDETHQNILTDILTFILTPSLHEAFDNSSEQLYRETYELAEERGFLGENCQILFPDCKHDILGTMTEVMFSNG